VVGAAAAGLEPLFEAHKAFVLGAEVLHADEIPVALLDPRAGKTRRAYIWGYTGASSMPPGSGLRLLPRPQGVLSRLPTHPNSRCVFRRT
jgi:hypothetical protein